MSKTILRHTLIAKIFLTCYLLYYIRVIVFNANMNNVSVISLVSALLVEETTDLPHVYWWRKPPTCRMSIGVGNHRTATSHWQNCITQCSIEYTSPWAWFELTTLVVIGTDCICSCKSNCHVITTTMAPIPKYTSNIHYTGTTWRS
jgi:hypothetical protein